MKLRRTMKAQSSKKKKKKEIVIIIKRRRGLRLGQARGHAARISVRPEEMQQGSQSGQRICSKKNQHQGPMYVQTHTKAIKNLEKPGIIFVTHGPSPWDLEWIVREKWFGR